MCDSAELLLWNELFGFGNFLHHLRNGAVHTVRCFDKHLGIPLFGTLPPSGPGHQHQLLGAAFSNCTSCVASTTHWHPLFPEAPHLVRRVVVPSKLLHLVAKDPLQQRCQLFELRFQVLQVFQVPFVTKIQTNRISSTVARHAHTRWTSRPFLRNSQGPVKGKQDARHQSKSLSVLFILLWNTFSSSALADIDVVNLIPRDQVRQRPRWTCQS